VDAWGEGVAGWSRSFSELMILARKLNATVVEPCIKEGRLVPCRKGNLNLFLGEVLDISSFRPWLGSQDEFERRAAVSHKARMCMHRGNGGSCGGATNFYASERSSVLDKAVLMGRTSASVLEISLFRQGAFLQMKVQGLNSKLVGIGSRELKQTKSKLLQFKQEHKDYARGMLKRLGVEKPYSVIHWRAEIVGIGK
jgi:hypothetical protein